MSFNRFQSYYLSELYEISSGLSKSRKEFGFGYPFVTFKDVFDNYYLPDKLLSLANTTDKERERCSVRKGDIFLTRTSETQEELGMSCVALKDYKDATFNGFTKRLRLKCQYKGTIDTVFMAYYMRSSLMRNQINSLSIMTTRASLNNSMIEKLKIEIPIFNEQRAIGKILISIDKKIEVNNQINKTLENIAQAIFKQWFVDFEFPNEDGQPYKSSGGEMVESELGKIPKGWDIVLMGNLCSCVLGGTPSRKKKMYWNGDIPWINSGEINKFRIIKPTEKITDTGLKKSSTKLLPKNTTVIAITGATLGKVSLLEIDSCTNQSVVGIIPSNDIPYTYIYPFIKFSINNLIGFQTGGAQQHINKGNIQNLKLILPTNNIIKRYNFAVKDLYKMISKNCFESNVLDKLRDTILPKLMSGEIRVPININIKQDT